MRKKNVKKSEKNADRREKRIIFRLNQKEYILLFKEFGASPFTKISQYIRAKLFTKTEMMEDIRQQNEALLAAAQTNTALIKLGVNINQMVKGMHTYKNTNFTPSEKDTLLQTNHLLQDLMNIYNNLIID